MVSPDKMTVLLMDAVQKDIYDTVDLKGQAAHYVQFVRTSDQR